MCDVENCKFMKILDKINKNPNDSKICEKFDKKKWIKIFAHLGQF